jgi:hypothetical protein
MVGTSILLGSAKLPIIPMLIAFLLLPLTLVLAMVIKFKNVDRVKEYACAEKIDYRFSSFYFSVDKATPYFVGIGIVFFVLLVFVGKFL